MNKEDGSKLGKLGRGQKGERSGNATAHRDKLVNGVKDDLLGSKLKQEREREGGWGERKRERERREGEREREREK